MDAFGVLGNPTRRYILELLASGEKNSGTITRAISEQQGISEAAVSQHLKALLDNGFATVRQAGMHRYYAIDIEGFHRLIGWMSRFQFRHPSPGSHGCGHAVPPGRDR
ncbi:ArsR/SmtB family transcription factor [Nocardia nova]